MRVCTACIVGDAHDITSATAFEPPHAEEETWSFPALGHLPDATVARLPLYHEALGRLADWYGDRVEPLDAAGELPAGPAVHECDRVLLAWPVKLTFAPALADRVHELLVRDRIQPAHGSEPPPLAAAEVGAYPWEAAAWRTMG